MAVAADPVGTVVAVETLEVAILAAVAATLILVRKMVSTAPMLLALTFLMCGAKS